MYGSMGDEGRATVSREAAAPEKAVPVPMKRADDEWTPVAVRKWSPGFRVGNGVGRACPTGRVFGGGQRGRVVSAGGRLRVVPMFIVERRRVLFVIARRRTGPAREITRRNVSKRFISVQKKPPMPGRPLPRPVGRVTPNTARIFRPSGNGGPRKCRYFSQQTFRIRPTPASRVIVFSLFFSLIRLTPKKRVWFEERLHLNAAFNTMGVNESCG